MVIDCSHPSWTRHLDQTGINEEFKLSSSIRPYQPRIPSSSSFRPNQLTIASSSSISATIV